MSKGESLKKRSEIHNSGDYDYLKEIISMAKKNGWDLDTLGLIAKDLPAEKPVTLTKKQTTQRNKLVRSILSRFSELLTSPVPQELEDYIRSKSPDALLPWEIEALERVDDWRHQINELRPAILNELRRVLVLGSEITK